jgi:hypothetical protein
MEALEGRRSKRDNAEWEEEERTRERIRAEEEEDFAALAA